MILFSAFYFEVGTYPGPLTFYHYPVKIYGSYLYVCSFCLQWKMKIIQIKNKKNSNESLIDQHYFTSWNELSEMGIVLLDPTCNRWMLLHADYFFEPVLF